MCLLSKKEEGNRLKPYWTLRDNKWQWRGLNRHKRLVAWMRWHPVLGMVWLHLVFALCKVPPNKHLNSTDMDCASKVLAKLGRQW